MEYDTCTVRRGRVEHEPSPVEEEPWRNKPLDERGWGETQTDSGTRFCADRLPIISASDAALKGIEVLNVELVQK